MKQSLPTLTLAALFAFQTSDAFTVHEWGTFTQVIGSDGTVLDGLEREEEALPSFVHSHAGLANSFLALKGFRRPVKGVNTKMETPVIYFYTDKALQAEVDVKWNGGSISQWYPQRTGGETPPTIKPKAVRVIPGVTMSNSDFSGGGGIDFAQGYDGSINWKVEIAPKNQFDQADLFKGHETVSWLHPRVPGASVVTSGTESEGYLFYRGIDRLDSGIHFAIDEANSLTISNALEHNVPFAFVFQNDGRTIRSKVISSGLDSGSSLTIPDQDLAGLGPNWQSTVYRQMRKGLVQAGLYQEEAEAMIQTWWSSYFAKPSLNGSPRVFWILPTQQVDEILPLAINPKPEKTVRVIVGRAEILRPSAEEAILAMDRNAQGLPTQIAHDRFALAYRNRIQQLESSAKITP